MRQGVALVGGAIVWELIGDSVAPPESSFGGVLFGPADTISIPNPPSAPPLFAMNAVSDARGGAHVLWGTSGDSTSRAQRTVDTIWYARLDGERWTRPEVVLTNVERRSRLEWNKTSEAVLLVGDSTLYAVVPSHDTVFVLRRNAGRWTRSRLPFGSFYTTLIAGHRGTLILGFAPAYFPAGRWDTKAVYVTRSHDGGVTWTQPIALRRWSDGGPGLPSALRLLAADTSLYLVGTYGTRGTVPDSVFLMESSDGGESWRSLPTLHVPGGIHSMRGVIDGRGRILVAGTDAFGGGTLTTATWIGERWLGPSLPFDPTATTSIDIVAEASLGVLPPDSVYFTWMIMRPVRPGLLPNLPGAPITMLSVNSGCGPRSP